MPNRKKKAVSISEIGEFGLIEHLARKVKLRNASSLKGIGDDAAVVSYGGKTIVLTTDLLIEGIHFNLVYAPLKHLGYKAAVVNLSDIYAMNAIPKQITVSIAISGKFSLNAVELFYEGINLACDRYNVDLIGGDTSSSITGLMVSITALGEAEKDQIVYRSNARKDDLICVSGDLGAAYMGLQLLEREKKIFEEDPGIQPDLSGNEYILGRQLKPEAREDIITWFREKKVKPTAMIDISDGLSSDLLHLCSASGVGCRIYQEKIPVDRATAAMAEEFRMDPLVPALNGGEDYELLFTVSLSHHEILTGNPQIHVIGHITDAGDGRNLITREGNAVELVAQGWNPLREEESV
ncbi:MAG: thiamine-phosphate kinase [Bacteroidales bacterium]|nr:MAG: thiamine-phosphate kinase [Bacteroidales bacterium]